jgi:DNA-binding response OmpR family regulator
LNLDLFFHHDLPSGEAALHPPFGGGAVGSVAVAIVDEDSARCAQLAEVLQRGGYLAHPFLRAEDALRSLWDEPVDLVLLDLGLTSIDARSLSRELRQRPWGRGLPILGLRAARDPAQRPSSADFTRLLPDDFHPADLLRSVFEALVEPSAALGLLSAELDLPQEELSLVPARPMRTEVPRLQVRIPTAREYAAEYTLHLSTEHVFVSTYSPLPVGSVVDLALDLPFAPPTLLQARVESCAEVDSAQARLGGPGMRLGLLGVSPELKVAMASFMAGLRAGASEQPLPGLQTLVLFVGRENRLPAGAPSFLRRSGIRALRCVDVHHALSLAARRSPHAVVLDAEALGAGGGAAAVAGLRRAGVPSIVVLASPSAAVGMPAGVTAIDPAMDPRALLEQLSEKLAVARRASARVSCPAPVRAERPGGALDGQVENVSTGGILMRLDESFAPGERLRLEFELPEQNGLVRALAQAVRVSRTRDSALRVAAAFERLEGDSARHLREYIRSRATA